MKEAPVFDRKFLTELSNGMLYRGAEALLESGAVECAEWDPPILRGQVVVDGERFCPELNLRSTVFAENKCSCLAGRRRQICVHAIACALYYQAIQSEDAHERLAQAHLKNSAAAQEESAVLPRSALTAIEYSAAGNLVRIKGYLPPIWRRNRSRCDCHQIGGSLCGPIGAAGQMDHNESLAVSQPYCKFAIDRKLVWGKLPSLLQLTAAR